MNRREAIGAMAAFGAAGGVALGQPAPTTPPAARPKPVVIGHRGASALRPEHTLAAYAKAIADGADMIEPDLVATKDGALVARHENEIGGTTDVAGHPEYAGRRRTKRIDGADLTGWFTEDFTLAELKGLRAIERLGAVRPEAQGYDGHFQIVTFDEVLDFAAAESAARGRTIGVVPELKHSTYFAGIGLPLEDRFLAVLGAHRFAATAPILIQSFETANLRYLRGRIGRPANVRLVQLIDQESARPADSAAKGDAMTYGDMLKPGRLSAIAAYADILSPATRSLIPLTADGRLGRPTRVVEDAHAAGLQMCCYTFRPENRFLAADFRSDAGENARNPAGSIAEMRRYVALGLDALFTDDPALGRAAVDG